MTALVFLVTIALFLGLLGLVAFFWALKNGQYEDIDGAAWRVLQDDDPDGVGDRSRRRNHDTR